MDPFKTVVVWPWWPCSGWWGPRARSTRSTGPRPPKLPEIVKWPRSEQTMYLRGSLDELLDQVSGEVWHCTTPRAAIVADAVDMLPRILPRMKGAITGSMYMMARAAANGCTWKTVKPCSATSMGSRSASFQATTPGSSHAVRARPLPSSSGLRWTGPRHRMAAGRSPAH